jgi:hypothetical protein
VTNHLTPDHAQALDEYLVDGGDDRGGISLRLKDSPLFRERRDFFITKRRKSNTEKMSRES